jgi:rhamnogalacturonyl hydrolase YesR
MTPDEPWLWRPTMVGSRYDPCSVHTGAAGQLIALNQALRAGRGEQIESTVDTTARWLAKRLVDEPKLLPGMTFGRAGTALALVEAGTLLDDARLTATGLGLARRLPTSWPVLDVFHGVAGAGIALLRLWRLTDDPEFLDRARRCAAGVLAEMRIGDGLVTWTATGDFILAGKTHWGFAHGVAGIGTFLVEAGLATGDARYTDAARLCVATLAEIADHDGPAAFWPSGEPDVNADTRRMTGLCSGSSGVGTFLLRFFAATGESTAKDLAKAAAFAVRCANWVAPPVWCHGLASDGDYLLDCAQVFGEARYRDWAVDTADIIAARTVLVDGRALTPDETGGTVVSYGNGFVGPLSFLLRLRHGGDRPMFGSPTMVGRSTAPRSLTRLDMLEGGVLR